MSQTPETASLVDDAMRALQAALVTRDLYAPDHPAVRAQEARATESLGEALAHEPEVCVLAFEDRLLYRNAALPCGTSLLQGLFARLRARGCDALRVRSGVTGPEVSALLGALSAPGAAPLAGTPHITVARLDGLEPASRPGRAHRPPRDHAQSIERLWRRLHERGDCDTDAVESIIAEICAAVAVSSGAMTPLAHLKSHDEYTFVHTINVAILSAGLAEAVGLPPEAVHDITAGALLHDVGKQAMPPEVLNKNGQLTDEEMVIMRRHPVEGARILFGARHVPDAARIIAYEHHMHIDGTGYPAQPPGWRVALPSQIVQVADVFDALRTERPYRAAMPKDEALAILQKNAGKWFDAQLLDVFTERVVNAIERAAA